jgi:hypothetical protein
MFPIFFARLRPLSLSAVLFAALMTLGVSGCTTDPVEDEFTTAPSTSIVYNDTTHVARPLGTVCDNTTRYLAYWSLSYLAPGGDTNTYRWLGVSVSAAAITTSTWSVGANADGEDAESPPGKASVLLFDVSGSQNSATARIRVTPFANGDSVRVEGKNIVLQNGKVIDFNLTNQLTCNG